MISVYPLANLPSSLKKERVVKYRLVWCESGSLVMEIDNEDYHLGANSVVTITSGQIHGVKTDNSAAGLVLEFTYDYFCKTDDDVELVFHNGLFCHFGMNEVIQLTSHNTVSNELRQIEKELAQKPYQFLLSVHSRIELILIEVNRNKLLSGGEVYRPDALFLKFLDLVISQSNHTFSAGDAARSLGTSVFETKQTFKVAYR